MTAQTPGYQSSVAAYFQGSGPVNTITALAGGGAVGCPVLASWINEVSVCATNNDSVMLPPAFAGLTCWVINDGAATLAVFANTNNAGVADKIVGSAVAGGAGAASITQATTKSSVYVCYKQGLWKQFTSA
jgi:hypothetical protein